MSRTVQATATGSQSIDGRLAVSATKSGGQIQVVIGKGAFSLTLSFDNQDQVNELAREIAAHARSL